MKFNELINEKIWIQKHAFQKPCFMYFKELLQRYNKKINKQILFNKIDLFNAKKLQVIDFQVVTNIVGPALIWYIHVKIVTN